MPDTHEVWNHGNQMVYLPIPGQMRPMSINGRKGFNTSDENIILAAMDHGKPLGVKELEDTSDATENVNVDSDNQPL